jgi:D-glycero-alpha-D-manno-heptose-7-phosphate kinase
MYISSHKFFENDKIRTKYSQTETVNHISELKHPILRTALEMFDIKGGLEISSIADVPSGTGMGSSSSFTVGLLHNLYAYKQLLTSKEMLASGACDIEINQLKEPIGKQDQYAAAYGGLNLIEFLPDGSTRVQPVYMSKEYKEILQNNLLLFYLGSQRKASDILVEQRKNTATAEDKFKVLEQMVDMVYLLHKEIIQGNLDEMGKILHQGWMLKRQLASGISSGFIDQVYEAGIKAGALGGKLLGAGGGGFMLFYAPKEKHNKIRETLKDLKPFDFAFENEGSKLIYFNP